MRVVQAWLLPAAMAAASAWAQTASEPAITFKCPGNVYTNMISPQEAKARGCTTIEGAPITIVQTVRPRPPVPPSASAPRPPSAPGAQGDMKVDPQAQRQRDSDARRILEAELRREEERLASLQREFNGGNPERRGDEQNYAKYQERVAEMKTGITRKEADIAAIKRELAKLPP